MVNGDIKTTLLTILAVAFTVVILYFVIRITLKLRKSPTVKSKKDTKVLEDISAGPESDSIFNTIIATKRIAVTLEKRGIDTNSATLLIKKAEADYDSGKEESAKRRIEEAKDILMKSKEEWDKKTGFDVVSSTPSAETKSSYKPTVDLAAYADSDALEDTKEAKELSKADQKKPDNYLPSKFTISLAGTAIEKALNEGADVGEAQRLLIEAKACFDREDYDQAFKLALSCKKNAEGLICVDSSIAKEDKDGISDLATPSGDAEALKICSICSERKIPYICIEVDGGEEATCKECYDKTMGKEIKSEASKEEATAFPPPPPPVPTPPPAPEIEEKKEAVEEKEEAEAHFCPNCGAKVKAEDVFCGKCGKPVKEELKCVGCGTKVEPGDVFCRKCGARLVT
jgi:hypothetical protein